MKVKIDKWVAVATWKWDINMDKCNICMNNFE